jgi:hypothetical protein
MAWQYNNCRQNLVEPYKHHTHAPSLQASTSTHQQYMNKPVQQSSGFRPSAPVLNPEPSGVTLETTQSLHRMLAYFSTVVEEVLRPYTRG